MNPPTFTADIPAGKNKRTFSFTGFYSDKAMFLT